MGRRGAAAGREPGDAEPPPPTWGRDAGAGRPLPGAGGGQGLPGQAGSRCGGLRLSPGSRAEPAEGRPGRGWARAPQAAEPRRGPAGSTGAGARRPGLGRAARRAPHSPPGSPGPTLPVPRPLTCPAAAAPPSSSISRPGPQLRAPPGMMQCWRRHRHRRRLRASRSRRHGAAEGAAPSAGHSGPAPRLPRGPSPPCGRPRAWGRPLRPRPPSPRRARCLGLAGRPFREPRRPEGERTGQRGG